MFPRLPVILACVLSVHGRFAAAVDDVPSHGAMTRGGQGGQIVRVTTLAASGKGSLAAALDINAPRIIVFEVGGVIDLGGRSLKLARPFVTVAGQTAPSPGITLIRGGLNILTHDVIVEHLRVRAGEAGRKKKSGWEVDGIGLISAHEVKIDHCTSTWATDENLSASGPRFEGVTPEEWRKNTSHHVTISNCLIAEALSKSTHGKGEHSKGSLLHDNASAILISRNLYASNRDRNPLAKGGVRAAIVNNWIANPGRHAMHHALVSDEWGKNPPQASRLVIAGNLLEYGPDTLAGVALFSNRGTSPLELWMGDNLAFDREGKPAPLTEGATSPEPLGNALASSGIELLPATKVRDQVTENVGARPWDRDAIDQRIIAQALKREGRIIDSESEVGGYPQVSETRAEFRPEEWNLDTMERRASPGKRR